MGGGGEAFAGGYETVVGGGGAVARGCVAVVDHGGGGAFTVLCHQHDMMYKLSVRYLIHCVHVM